MHSRSACPVDLLVIHAAMDGVTAKLEGIRDKILGGKQPAQQLGEKRQEIREVLSSEMLQEIFLK